MGEPVPVMDEPTHDKMTEALQHLSVEHYGMAEEAIHEALDRLEGASWDGVSGADYPVAYIEQTKQ